MSELERYGGVLLPHTEGSPWKNLAASSLKWAWVDLSEAQAAQLMNFLDTITGKRE